jgi:phosphoribosylanthranilate isomerase
VKAAHGSGLSPGDRLKEVLHVKICGITTLEDAQAAIQCGADMLGFNFYPPSPRAIAPRQCARLVADLAGFRTSGLMLVGVFVNASPATIAAILADCDLDLAQLSGDEPPESLQALAGRAYKALRPRNLQDARRQVAHYTACPPTPTDMPIILLDASQPGAFGGTGKTIDWALARQIARQHILLLAGGLAPHNVAAAVRQVHPWGVDVASGVESCPGRKDPEKMAAFVAAARQAFDHRAVIPGNQPASPRLTPGVE